LRLRRIGKVIASAGAALADNGVEQLTTLVAFWLRENPADDLDVFALQAARAKWMEGRVFQTVADILGKIMGGK